MQKRMKDYLEELRRQKKRRRKAGIAVMLLVVLVVGTVAGGLTQYGVAMTGDVKCGLTEHEHTEECYEDVLICGYGDTDISQEEDDSKEDTVTGDTGIQTGQEDTAAPQGEQKSSEAQEGHQHTKDCYEVEDVLECGLEETEGHTHGKDCYEEEPTLVCETEESEGHAHDDSCYETEEVLDCEEEHEHTAECYQTEDTLTCETEESEGHTHDDGCYESESVITCKEEESEGHTHEEDCYKQEEILTCDKEEGKEEPVEASASETDTALKTTVEENTDAEQHIHTEDCYERQLVCGLEEHQHTDECLIDLSADVEDMSVWDALYADTEWTDSWGEDLVTAARMQIGYRESLDNYQIAEDGSHKGYTRYGEFAGDPYVDWDAAFVNFCMYYAGLSESGLFPSAIYAAQWIEEFAEINEQSDVYLAAPADHVPAAGDLIFFESEEEESRMGIVSSYEETTNEIQVIEGNSSDEVKENTYGTDDSEITAYLKIGAFEDVEDMSIWDAQYADVVWKDVWGEDLVTAARMQIGYQESQNNYQTAEDGSHKGYTRYGAFAGDAYADWDAAFVNFCMHYAGLSASHLFPVQMEAAEWYKEFQEINVKNSDYLTTPEEYVPMVGDLVFFRNGEVGQTTHMGIVSSSNEETNEIQVIEGNHDGEVRENTYSATDSQIMSYLKITELESVYKGNLLRYEDDQVEILVTAIEENAIPEGSSLKVVPILKDKEETREQYQAVEAKLQEKALQSDAELDEIVEADESNEDTEFDEDIEAVEMECTVAGFLAYDISIINIDGVEVEPVGNVSVSIQYKNATLPEGIEDNTDELYVTMVHLEEDEEGEVKEVVDMMKSEQLKKMMMTENNEIQRVEFETVGFSTFVVEWTDTQVTTYAADTVQTLATNDSKISSVLGPPEHNKYIKKNNDGTYTISLDVKGATKNRTVDLILIVDTSSSMINRDNRVSVTENGKTVKKTREELVQDAIEEMITSAKALVKADPALSMNVAIVEFSDGYNKAGDFGRGSPYYRWYKNNGTKYMASSLSNATGSGADKGKDNWYFPFSSKGGNTDATRYNVKSKVPNNAYVYGDTKPDAVLAKEFTPISAMKTYRYEYPTAYVSGGNEDGTPLTPKKGWDSYKEFGCGTNWQAGIRLANETLKSRPEANETYAIFLTDGLPTARYKTGTKYTTQGAISDTYYADNEAGYKDKNNTNYKAAVNEWNGTGKLKNSKAYVVYVGDANCKARCDDFAVDIVAENNQKALNGKNPANLKKAFDKVLEDIVPAYNNVAIRDTLSANVEYAYKDLATIKKNFKVVKIPVKGNEQTLKEGTDYTLEFSDTNTKQFTIRIKEPKLEKNATYRVQIDVVPSESATVFQLKNNKTYPGGYPDKGDKDTDGPGTVANKTSSDKEGFYSNSSARVYYTVTGEERANDTYKMPVIQVDETTWTAKKDWKNGTPTASDDVVVTVSLTATKKDGKTELGYINNALTSRNLKTQELKSSNNWTVTWKQLPKYYYTEYDSKGRAVRTEVKYIVKEVKVTRKGVDVTSEYQSTTATSGTTTTLANTRKGILYVEKFWEDGNNQHAGDPVLVGLYKKNGTQETPVTGGDVIYKNAVLVLNKDNNWKSFFSFGAAHHNDLGSYTVKELKEVTGGELYDFQLNDKYYKGIDHEGVAVFGNTRYVVTYGDQVKTTSEDGTTIKITNTPAPGWQIKKRSSSDRSLYLSDAKFNLMVNNTTYQLISDANGVIISVGSGVIKWTKPDKTIQELAIEGETYVLTLTEIEAPVGYELDETPRNITVTNGIPTIGDDKGETVEGILTFYYDNDVVLYELPSTGGSGIYGYMFGGVLMMMFAALIIYGNKRKEVLKS